MKYYEVLDHLKNALKTDLNCPLQSVSEFLAAGLQSCWSLVPVNKLKSLKVSPKKIMKFL